MKPGEEIRLSEHTSIRRSYSNSYGVYTSAVYGYGDGYLGIEFPTETGARTVALVVELALSDTRPSGHTSAR